MPGNTFGQLFKTTTFGESHGPAIGAIIDGCPPRIPLDEAAIQQMLDKRRPGQSKSSTPRREPDRARILSGTFDGLTTGTPITILIENKDADSSSDSPYADLYRPGHGDFTYDKKYGIRDWRGGGRSSARETAARVAAGAVAKALLDTAAIKTTAYTHALGRVTCTGFDPDEIANNPYCAPDPHAARAMEKHSPMQTTTGDGSPQPPGCMRCE